jgi:hypothetical protein
LHTGGVERERAAQGLDHVVCPSEVVIDVGDQEPGLDAIRRELCAAECVRERFFRVFLPVIQLRQRQVRPVVVRMETQQDQERLFGAAISSQKERELGDVALRDAPPYVYWYRIDEVYELLRSVGFIVQHIGSRPQVCEARMCKTPAELLPQRIKGMIYCVCSK